MFHNEVASPNGAIILLLMCPESWYEIKKIKRIDK